MKNYQSYIISVIVALILMLTCINLLNIINYIRLLRKLKVLFFQTVMKKILLKLVFFFISKDYRRGWKGLKKIAKPVYSLSHPHSVKSKSGQDLFYP